MASTENSNKKEKKEWVNPEFLSENIQKTESGWTGFPKVEGTWYSS